MIHETLQTTAVGLLLGFVLSLAAGVAGRRVLFGVTPTDPPTYIGVVAVLAIASVIASYVPAWRAGRVNVVEALDRNSRDSSTSRRFSTKVMRFFTEVLHDGSTQVLHEGSPRRFSTKVLTRVLAGFLTEVLAEVRRRRLLTAG